MGGWGRPWTVNQTPRDAVGLLSRACPVLRAARIPGGGEAKVAGVREDGGC